jgi:hypothetical protein
MKCLLGRKQESWNDSKQQWTFRHFRKKKKKKKKKKKILREELNGLLQREDIKWQQRSKENWLKIGDRNVEKLASN